MILASLMQGCWSTVLRCWGLCVRSAFIRYACYACATAYSAPAGSSTGFCSLLLSSCS